MAAFVGIIFSLMGKFTLDNEALTFWVLLALFQIWGYMALDEGK